MFTVLAANLVSTGPLVFFGIQFLCLAIVFWVLKRLLKLSKEHSALYSTGFTVVATVLLWTFVMGQSLNRNVIFLCGLPLLIFAAVMVVRVLVRVAPGFLDSMDDGGNVNSAERERTLEMVEQGKISAEEGAELLDALGRSSAMLGQDKFSRMDMLILVGIAITVLGFFLPWVEFSITNMAQFQSQQMAGMGNPLAAVIKSVHGRNIAYQSGYQIGAIGWAIFVVAVLAVVPVFITPKGFLYKMSMLQMFLVLLDVALVVSLLIRVGGSMSVGLPFCLVGLVLAAVACFGKFKKLAA
jgi:hypothetical protein